MSPEAQRIAIAKACGWTQIGAGLGWMHPRGYDIPCCPAYLTDLNAMHEAEKVLTEEQWPGYILTLNRIMNFTEDNDVWTCHATAAHRAEAFLRTLNLWDDSK